MCDDNLVGIRSSLDEGAGAVDILSDLGLIGGPRYDRRHEPNRGLLHNEVPFRCDLIIQLMGPAEECLALRPLSECVRAACAALVANVLYAYAGATKTWVFYSRDHNHYAACARARRYTPPFYTFANVMAGVEHLEQLGFIEHQKSAPSPSAMFRSRIRASAFLLRLLENVEYELLFKQQEVIVLRDADGRFLDYRDSKRIRAMRDDAVEHNQFLAGIDVHVDHPDAHYDKAGFLRIKGLWLDPRRCEYHRVFNGGWRAGGRWYGPFWQQLPSKIRPHLRINREPVVECDYRACHLKLLCALSGIELPFHEEGYDPYRLTGIPRDHVKSAFNIMLNASTEPTARWAIVDKVGINWGDATRLMERIKSNWPRLERYWCSGMGLRLQGIDAEICARVQRRLRRAMIPVLSIHDGFIVASRTKAELGDIMDKEMARTRAYLALRGLSGEL